MEQVNPNQELEKHAWLLWEAGEGWHSGGLNKELLSALVVREKIADEMAYQRREFGGPDQNLTTSFEKQKSLVDELKKQFGIENVPPRPLVEQ